MLPNSYSNRSFEDIQMSRARRYDVEISILFYRHLQYWKIYARFAIRFERLFSRPSHRKNGGYKNSPPRFCKMPRRKYPRRGFKITPQRGHACTTPKRSAKSIAKINAEKFCREAFFGVKMNSGAGLRRGLGRGKPKRTKNIARVTLSISDSFSLGQTD